jgi:hypothetical protein
MALTMDGSNFPERFTKVGLRFLRARQYQLDQTVYSYQNAPGYRRRIANIINS